MTVAAILVATLALLLAGPTRLASDPQMPESSEFVGSTLCGEMARSFLGGLPAGAPCHAITWRLTLGPTRNGTSIASVRAVYGIPPASNPNQMVEGPKVALDGAWEMIASANDAVAPLYRVTIDRPRRSLSFVRITHDLIHLVDDGGRLMVGNGGWSYTLNRAERAEKPGNPSNAPEMSYTISARGTGRTVFGVFEGRTPCAGIAQELGIQPPAGCMKVKWRITLNQDPETSEPTTYKVEGSLHRQRAREGRWRIYRSSNLPQTVLYELAPTSAEKPLVLLKVDDNLLFFLNQRHEALVGNAEFSYTLNRVTAAK